MSVNNTEQRAGTTQKGGQDSRVCASALKALTRIGELWPASLGWNLGKAGFPWLCNDFGSPVPPFPRSLYLSTERDRTWSQEKAKSSGNVLEPRAPPSVVNSLLPFLRYRSGAEVVVDYPQLCVNFLSVLGFGIIQLSSNFPAQMITSPGPRSVPAPRPSERVSIAWESSINPPIISAILVPSKPSFS